MKIIKSITIIIALIISSLVFSQDPEEGPQGPPSQTTPNILNPYNLTALNITQTSASLSWNDPNPNNTSWEIGVYSNNNSPSFSVFGNFSEVPYTITGLTPGTGYSFIVRLNSSGIFTEWAGSYNFTTLSPIVETPIVQLPIVQNLCTKTIQPYSVNVGDAIHDASTYVWSVSPETPIAIITGNGTNSITIDWANVPDGVYTLQAIETNAAGCVSTAVSASINLSTTPTAPVAPATQTFCTASTVANLTATGTTLQWYDVATGGTALASTTALVSGTTYYVAQSTGTCESTRTAVAVTITPLTAPTAVAQTFCTSATVANLVATGTAIKWYAALTGGTALASTTALVTGTTYYASQTIGTCESARTAVAVTVTPIAAPTAVAQTFCNSATVANLVATGTAIKWYAAITGGTALASSTALVTGTTYYASQTIGTCESTRTAVAVTITPVTAPTAVAQTFCTSATVANLVATGTAIKWYAALTGGAALASTTALVTGTTFYVSQTTGTCESTRTAVAVTITPIAAPTAVAQSFCNSATVANLVVTGTAIKWYAALTGGTTLASSTTLVTGTTYYASQTVGTCESTRTAVAVTITIATAPTAVAQTFCNSATVANLVATGTAIQWYAAATGGTALASTTALVTGTTYYASQTVGTCESTRTAVAVTITPASAPTAVAQTFCTSATVANLVATGTAIKWYAALTGGTALASTTALATGTTYYVSQTVGTCESTRTAVAVTITPKTTPTFTQVAPICAGATLVALPTTSTNAVTGTWSPAINNTATTTYTFTPTTGLCANTATMTITVNPMVSPTFTQMASTCSNATMTPLPTTSNNGISGTWSPALNNTTTTTYTFTPTAGQCANTTTQIITITAPKVTSAISFVAPVAALPSVTIGTQVWTNKNLDVTTYRDGTPIPQVTDPTAWAALTTGAWCYYNNDPANGAIYGKLYNWYAAAGIYDNASLNNPSLRKQFAPIGWHVPSDGEWTTLGLSLGGDAVAGGKMKETGFSHWTATNTAATNSSGFTGLPGGYIYSNGLPYGINTIGCWWSSTSGINRSINFNAGNLGRDGYWLGGGFSIRLVKD
jgi:uncharacterized protein (TIGR02145 family)